MTARARKLTLLVLIAAGVAYLIWARASNEGPPPPLVTQLTTSNGLQVYVIDVDQFDQRLDRFGIETARTPLPALEAGVGSRLETAVNNLGRKPDGSDAGELGMILLAIGEHGVARSCFARAHETAGVDQRWPYYLAWLADQQGNRAVASRHYQTARDLGPDIRTPSLRLARIRLDEGDLGSALRLLQQLHETDPQDLEVLAELGRWALAKGEPSKALAYLNRGLKTSPGHRRLNELASRAHAISGDAALSSLHQRRAGSSVGALDPIPDPFRERALNLARPVSYLQKVAHGMRQQKRAEEATALFEEVARREPTVANQVALALSFHENNATDRALTLLGAILATGPKSAGPYEVRSIIAFDSKEYDDAFHWATMALERDPESHVALLKRARVLGHRGKPREGLVEIEKAIAIYPRDVEFLTLMGQLLFAEGRSADAERAFLTVLAIDPKARNARRLLDQLRTTSR